MKLGFCVMSDVDEIGFYPFIEALGYDSAWVADSQDDLTGRLHGVGAGGA
jgi:hypothetical protein